MEYVGYQTKKPNLLCKIELRSEQLLMLVEVASQTQALNNNWNFSMKKECQRRIYFPQEKFPVYIQIRPLLQWLILVIFV